MLVKDRAGPLQGPCGQQIVGRQEDEVVATGPVDALVVRRDVAAVDVMTDDGHVDVPVAQVLGDPRGVIGRAVVDDQHVDDDIRLIDDRPHAFWEEPSVVVAGDDDTEGPLPPRDGRFRSRTIGEHARRSSCRHQSARRSPRCAVRVTPAGECTAAPAGGTGIVRVSCGQGDAAWTEERDGSAENGGRPAVDVGRPKVIVAVCTYRRNEQLRRLLSHLLEAATEARELCIVGGVVVDDNADGSAEPVVAEFADRLELGVQYRSSGQQNISIARNLALEAALANGDWIVMTDDDCVPDRQWLVALVAAQLRTGADAISGPMVRRAPVDSPRWLVEQPLEQGVPRWERDTELWFASTHNSMLSSSWLRSHPDHRFDPQLGRLGGEDMLFFKTAHRRGLRITYSPDAIPSSRTSRPNV